MGLILIFVIMFAPMGFMGMINVFKQKGLISRAVSVG
jgi:hypothetical protein